MAEGKTSFIAYTSWKNIFLELPDDKAGQLVKHLFNYVTDENPQTKDILIKVAFSAIQADLKRDLKKWEGYIQKQSANGKKGGRPKKPKPFEKTQAFFEKPKKAEDVDVNNNNPLTPLRDLDEADQKQVRALANQICDYFSISEIRQANHMMRIHGFVKQQLLQENFDYLKQQFEFYKKFKTSTGQTKHSWMKWIESAWNERDWKAEFERHPTKPRPDTEIQPGNHQGTNPFLAMKKPEFRKS